MSPDDEARIRELSKLIANEKDLQKLIILASELERLLRLKLKTPSTSPIVDREPAES